MWRTLQIPTRLIADLAFDLKALHPERVPATGGVLMISNHQSYLDPPLLGAKLSRAMAYLANAELFEFGPFAWLIRSLNAFPIQQGRGDLGAMKQSIRLLQEGWMLNVFPEGSRTPDGTLHPAQKGAALIIRRAGVPVVPVVIDGSYAAWPKRQKFPRPHPIRILYGEPVQLSHEDPEHVVRWIDLTLKSMLAELRAHQL